MNTRINLLLCALLWLQLTHAQGFNDYTPLADDASAKKQLLQAIEGRHRQDLSSLSGPNRKQLAEIYKERHELILERFENGEIITHAQIQDYLQKLAQEIIRKNPSWSNAYPVRILFSRAWWANAASLGEGTIVFNIGLFSRLNNEAEAAFVICHELAHYYLDHSNRNIAQYVATINSEEFQKELKNIQRSSYNKNTQLEKLSLNLGFKTRRHSRELEKAADSMAIELMKNTSFDLGAALSCLALLDDSDKDKYAGELGLAKMLNFPAYPFRKRWLESDVLVFAETREEKEEKKVLEDSLKTHPDCSARMDKLKGVISAMNNPKGKSFLVSETLFNNLKSIFEYEALEYNFGQGKVSRALFMGLQMYRKDTTNAYLIGFIGKCFNRIYKAQKDHELGKIVDLPSHEMDPEYKGLLRMLQNLRLTELASINYYFLQSHMEKGKKSEEFFAALITATEYMGRPEQEKALYLRYYTNQFPIRKYQFN